MKKKALKLTDNIILNTDSYKTSHFGFMAPGTTKQYSYVEARKGGEYDSTIFFGLQKFIKDYLLSPITQEMIDQAEEIITSHGLPFNRSGWEYILRRHDGYLPLEIKAVPEGLDVPVGNVLVTVENTDKNCAWVTSYIETALLRAVWYGTTVATRSNKFRKLIEKYLKKTGDESLLDFKLVDFGARGVSSKESSEIGGAAHLVNFMATDNIVGILCTMEYYNSNEVTGFSIPACYDESTEVLTRNGFKLFSNLTEDDEVAQYDQDSGISFIKPSYIVKDAKYVGPMFEFSVGGETVAVVTPNHRMIAWDRCRGELVVEEASSITFSGDDEDTLEFIEMCDATEEKQLRTIRGVKKREISYNGRIGCVTVPSGMIITRRSNTMLVCGNSEHTVTIAEGQENEKRFFERAINVFLQKPGDMVSVVSDTYSFHNALDIWADLKDTIESTGGTVVVRPDSGDPKEMVMLALDKLSESYGYTINDKGYKVLNPHIRIIQGDGVSLDEVERILEAMMVAGYSADNVTFGCGGYLLQDLTRDTCRFAMKGSYVEVNGEKRAVRKITQTDPSKASKAGRVVLVRRNGELVTIVEDDILSTDTPVLETVFLNGRLVRDMSFEEVRKNSRTS